MMREEYDFSEATPNPYTRRAKRQVTIRLDEQVIAYFRALADDVGVPYQTLINLELRDCMDNNRRPNLRWTE